MCWISSEVTQRVTPQMLIMFGTDSEHYPPVKSHRPCHELRLEDEFGPKKDGDVQGLVTRR